MSDATRRSTMPLYTCYTVEVITTVNVYSDAGTKDAVESVKVTAEAKTNNGGTRQSLSATILAAAESAKERLRPHADAMMQNFTERAR